MSDKESLGRLAHLHRKSQERSNESGFIVFDTIYPFMFLFSGGTLLLFGGGVYQRMRGQ